jgi:nitroimidazol reductase NimA-like FMN-containing flavoprotein (pyridoxamine 5'-phosphate oxidase superfamily)
VRRKDKEITDIRAIEEIMEQAKICRLALSAKDRPYVVPLCFGYKDRCLYMHSAPHGRKIEMVMENSNVCVEFDIDKKLSKGTEPCKYTMQYKSAICFGRASLIDDPLLKRKGLDIIMAHYADGPFEYQEEKIEKIIVIKVEIESMTGKISGDG